LETNKQTNKRTSKQTNKQSKNKKQTNKVKAKSKQTNDSEILVENSKNIDRIAISSKISFSLSVRKTSGFIQTSTTKHFVQRICLLNVVKRVGRFLFMKIMKG